MPRSTRHRCALLALSSALLFPPGCCLLGVRLLPEEWGSADTPTVWGISVPVQLGSAPWRWGLPVSYTYSVSDDPEAGLFVNIDDLSVGVDYALLTPRSEWFSAPTYDYLPVGTYAYIGGGMSLLHAEMTDGGMSDADSALGAFIHCGIWRFTAEHGFGGFKIRYTAAGPVDLNGMDRRTDSLQLFLVFLPFSS